VRNVKLKGQVMDWNTGIKHCEYSMKLKVTLKRRLSPEDASKNAERETLQNHIDIHVTKWMSDPKNRQNLMNMILGNTGILI
jgi:hypothetical protein